MKKRAVLAILLINISLFLIVLGVQNVVATVTAVQPADVYIGRTTSTGIINTANLSIYGPNICTDYGDPFSPLNSQWALGPYTYHYRILIPSDYASDILRVELFDPDSINQAENTHAVSYSAYAHDSDLVNFPLTPENKICSSTDQKDTCLIPTGELDLVDPGGTPPVLLDQINPFWFVRIDENRGNGAAPGDGSCGQPDSYDPAFNTTTLYELFYYVQNPDRTVSKTPLANYTGQTGNGVRDNGNHLTDMRWVSPGGTQLFDQPAAVPVDPGSPSDFELSLSQDLSGIGFDPITGERYVYLDITTLSGASKNGFDIWAGPFYPGVSGDVNVRNIQVLNDPSTHSAQGVVVTALEYNPVNSNVDFATDIPLTYLDPEQAGQPVYVSLFDPDNGAQPPVVFYLDTVAESDWSLTFGGGDPDPDGVSGRCMIGSCNNQWIDPPYQILLPNLTNACDLANLDPQVCTPFYGGRLMARYIGGEYDTYTWQVNAEEGQPDPTAGCSAFPISITEYVRSVTPPGTGSNPYPDDNEFSYPLVPPSYIQFVQHQSDVPLMEAHEGDVFLVRNGTQPGNFGWLLWNNIYQADSAATLSRSLTWPGDSLDYPFYGYYEPGDPTDMSLNIGDWVAGSYGSISATAVQQALNEHIDLGRVLRLPTWDNDIAGEYHMSEFALFRLQGYSIVDGWLLLEFIGWDDSCGQNPVYSDSVTIDGSVTGLVDTSHIFTATVSPITTTLPLSYTWEATDHAPVTRSSSLTDVISFTWSITGTKTISVSTRFGVVDTHTIDINVPPSITLLPSCGTGPDVQFTVQGFNWPPHEDVALYWDDALLSTVNPGSSWSFSVTLQKLGAADGSHEVKAVADNGLVATAVFTIPCVYSPTDVTISGPTKEFINNSGTFTATVSPLTVTQPLTYTWEATGQPIAVQTGGITDTVSYTWAITGTKTITVTAENSVGGPVTTTHTVEVVEPLLYYLPVVFKEE